VTQPNGFHFWIGLIPVSAKPPAAKLASLTKRENSKKQISNIESRRGVKYRMSKEGIQAILRMTERHVAQALALRERNHSSKFGSQITSLA
jgi:hypothetical protein